MVRTNDNNIKYLLNHHTWLFILLKKWKEKKKEKKEKKYIYMDKKENLFLIIW